MINRPLCRIFCHYDAATVATAADNVVIVEAKEGRGKIGKIKKGGGCGREGNGIGVAGWGVEEGKIDFSPFVVVVAHGEGEDVEVLGRLAAAMNVCLGLRSRPLFNEGGLCTPCHAACSGF